MKVSLRWPVTGTCCTRSIFGHRALGVGRPHGTSADRSLPSWDAKCQTAQPTAARAPCSLSPDTERDINGISRRWIAGTAETLPAQAERRLDDRRYVVLLLDGKGFGDHLLVTAVGLDEQGYEHILGWWEGDSENTERCT